MYSIGRLLDDGLNIANDNDDIKLEKYIANCILNKSVQSAVLLQLCFYTENVNEIKSCCRNTYNSLFVCDIEEVYFKSKINRSNWNEERKYRITGSQCYFIYTYRGILIYSFEF